jgi:hypothetical protein
MENVDSYFEVFEKKEQKVEKRAFSFIIFYLPREMAAMPISWGELFIIYTVFRPKPLVVGNKNEKRVIKQEYRIQETEFRIRTKNAVSRRFFRILLTTNGLVRIIVNE